MNSDIKGTIFILLSAFNFSLMGIFIRLINQEVTPITQVMLRIVIATAVLFVFYKLKKRKLFPHKRTIALLAVAGMFGYALMVVFINFAFINTTFGMATVVQQLTQLFVLFLGLVFLGEKITKKIVVGVFLSLSGVYLIFQPTAEGKMIGITYGVIAAFLQAIYNVIQRYNHKFNKTYINVFYSFFFASIVLIPLSFLLERPFSLTISPLTWGYLGFMVFNNILAYYFLNSGLRLIQANKASIIATFQVFLGVLYSYFFYNEGLTMLQATGSGLILGSVIILNLKR